MRLHWRQMGFLHPPTHVQAKPGLKLFRAWGGDSQKRSMPGRDLFLSLQRPVSSVDAERMLSVWEYGNACRWVTEFRLPAGTPLWIGTVDPGLDVDPLLVCRRVAIQVVVEAREVGRLREFATTALRQDTGGRTVVRGNASTSH